MPIRRKYHVTCAAGGGIAGSHGSRAAAAAEAESRNGSDDRGTFVVVEVEEGVLVKEQMLKDALGKVVAAVMEGVREEVYVVTVKVSGEGGRMRMRAAVVDARCSKLGPDAAFAVERVDGAVAVTPDGAAAAAPACLMPPRPGRAAAA